MPGPLDHESPTLARLFALGATGVAEEAGERGPETVAYFPDERPLDVEGRWESVDEVDHVRAYRAGLRPVRIGPLVVSPTHRRPSLRAGEQVVWLDPATAFGTGHHETTRLALGALTELDLSGRSLLDVGAGSGILAIAADRLGAASALGVDIDAATVPVARANAALNRSRARFLAGSLDHPELPRCFDVIVANLYAEVHVTLMPAYLERLAAGGRLLLTGVLARLAPLVEAALPPGLEAGVARDGEWVLFELAAPA